VYADSISVDGKTYENVVVWESATRYLVELPEQGSVLSVSKDDVSPATVRIDRGADRDALHQKWAENSPYAQSKVPAVHGKIKLSASSTKNERPAPIRITNVDSEDGSNQEISERGTSESANASYAQQYAALLGQTSGYAPGYSLPRSNAGTPGFRATRAPRTSDFIIHQEGGRSAAVSSNQGFGGGFGGGAGGFAGAAGQGGFGGGGFGGGGFGGGGFGGGGFGGGAPIFSNISDLFSTIDDRLVGETPAVIGMQVSVSR